MNFEEAIKDVARRSRHNAEIAETEEATKMAVIVPFIRALGYDVFDLSHVVPEFCADVGIKKGEKVDYALKIDGKVAVLVEAKPFSTNLGSVQYSQLFRYFTVTDARLAILSNGREVWFFSDIEEKNKMDKSPFFKFNFENYDKFQLESLQKFHRDSFDLDAVLSTASVLRYSDLASGYLKRQLHDPDENFVRFVGKEIYDGSLTKGVVEQLKPSIRAALESIVRSEISEKLGVAFQPAVRPEVQVNQDNADVLSVALEVVTTDEEAQAFLIVRAICAEIADVDRIFIRDTKSYCGVNFDDNNRKPVCRFWFNAKSVKYIGLFDEERQETKHEIASVSQIYKFATHIRKTVSAYL
ncbi:type I restriction endonuclease [Pannonibacter sp.]|uniref:type I restriction endonuclease n=1 Tax=Pannonibacter sp. TaxID=1906786 RepID=UPI003F6FEBF9